MRIDPRVQRELLAWRLFFFEGFFLVASLLLVRWLASSQGNGLEAVACDTGVFAHVPYLIDRAASYCADPVSRTAVALYFVAGMIVIVGTLVKQIRSPRSPMALGHRYVFRHVLRVAAIIFYLGIVAMWLTGYISQRGHGFAVFDDPLDVMMVFAAGFFLPAMQMMAIQPYVRDKPYGLGAILPRPR